MFEVSAHFEVAHPPFPEGIRVVVTWEAEGLDRKEGVGWLLAPNHGVLARRLIRAINSGVVFSNPELRTDVNNRTFVQADCTVYGRRINADLKRLGF